MRLKSKIITNTEPILIIGLWMFVFAIPVIMFQYNETLEWVKILNAWRDLLPFFILFLINHFILVPLLLFKNKKLGYLISVVLLVSAFSFGMYYLESQRFQKRTRQERNILPPVNRRPQIGVPPDMKPLPPRNKPNPIPLPPIVNAFIICILITGFDTGLRMIVRWTRSEKERTILEKENVQNQLAFLRNQVSPHFLMNTLNNIHILIDINTEEAKDVLIKLSKLMRHLLYESNENFVPLNRELEFINSYINLMKLRYTDRVEIKLEIPDEIPQKQIPPLIFTSFVENAFKHGISYQIDSYIDIRFSIDGDYLNLLIKNSIAEAENESDGSGIGMFNSVKRLDILYGKDYSLNVETNSNEYNLTLSIPV